MKNETKMTKLTPAQAYALQVKADRRAAAAERREALVAGDNARVNQMYKTTTTTVTTKTPKKAAKKVRWSDAEQNLIVDLYLLAYDRPELGEVNWAEVWPLFNARFPERSQGSFCMTMSQISSIDNYVKWKGLSAISRSLAAKLRAADPERFAA